MKTFKDFLLTKGISQDAFGKLEDADKAKLHGEFLDVMAEKVAKSAGADDLSAITESVKAFEAAVKELTDKNVALEAIVKTQGEALVVQAQKTGEFKPDIMDAFKEVYDAAEKNGDHTLKNGEKLPIDISKVTVSTDVLTATTVSAGTLPASGGTRAVDANMTILGSQNLGFASYRKPYSPIMDVVDVMPLDGEYLLVVNESVTGDAAITAEGALKPIVKVTYGTQTSQAAFVAAEWATTTQLRKFYPNIANRIRAKIAELVMDKTPASVLAAVVAGGTAFTANAALAINEDPNNYDALGAAIAQLQKLGFLPNAIVLSPEAWYAMVHTKATDGHYSVWNGNAISLVGDIGLNYQGSLIRFVIDPTIAADRFIVGDMMQSVKVGLDNELMYFETDGRTDAVATVASGLSRNIRTHVLERAVATLIPTPTAIGIISDTFANVKTLITAP